MKPHIKKVRRKIKRNQTYRTLKAGEIVRKGDEFKISKDSISWIPAIASIGYKVISDEPGPFRPGPFRRPVVERKPLSRKQVEKNREEAASLAEEKERLLREEDERERAHGEGRFTPRFASDDPIWTKIEFKPDPDLQSQLNEIQAGPPALDIQVDTGKPYADWTANPTDEMVDDALVRISEDLRKQRRQTRTYEWQFTPMRFMIYSLFIVATLFGFGLCTGAVFKKPEIQYRDKIQLQYSRPMELNGIPDNPWRKAIPILPEDIKIERKPALDQGETRKA